MHSFSCRCEHGVLKTCYGEGDLEPFQGKLDLAVEGWKEKRVLSLREAAHLLNPKNEFQSSCCNCKTGCTSQRCICRKKGATCSSKCHGGHKCNSGCESEDSDSGQPSRERSKNKARDHEATVVLSSDDDSDACQPQKKKRRQKPPLSDGSTSWIPELFLSAEDKRLIEMGNWLTDKHITAAQMLLQKHHPKVDGLQSPTLAQTGGWNILVSEGVQILNDSNKHWVCVSTIGCSPNTIDLYDSLSSKASPNLIKQIATFLHCWTPHFTIRVISCQLQEGSSDCSLFAIAAATSLCHGESPTSIRWDQKAMRAHLVESFEHGKMAPFPGWGLHSRKIGAEDVVKNLKVQVYCSCRLPQDRKKMAQCVKCSDWFHQICENIPDVVFKRKSPFTCASGI